MAYKVKVTESADRDLDEILTYIMETLMNPKAADDFVDALEEKYTVLEEYPFICELSRNDRLANRGYRRVIIGSYVVLYLIDEEQQEVTVTRIFYGRQNYEKYV